MDELEIEDVTAGEAKEPVAGEDVALVEGADGGAVVTPDAQSAAIARLRDALLATDAAIDPELVRGDSVAELEASFAAARALVARIREAVRQEQAAAIPAGSGARGGEQPSSAFEKIRAGLSGR